MAVKERPKSRVTCIRGLLWTLWSQKIKGAFHKLTLCIQKDFPIHVNTISMGLLIVYFKGSQIEFSKLLCISEGCFNLCLFVLILYVPVNNFLIMSQRVFLSWTVTKQGIKCLAQGHNAVPPVKLEPATPRSRVKYSTTALPFVLILANSADLIKCSIMLHFIWVFTVCQSTSLEFSSFQRVNIGTISPLYSFDWIIWQQKMATENRKMVICTKYKTFDR